MSTRKIGVERPARQLPGCRQLGSDPLIFEGLVPASRLLALKSQARLRDQLGIAIDTAAHKSEFVTAKGIRLHYIDWGGLGPVLILIHGGLNNAHIFDDLAPAFTDHF